MKSMVVVVLLITGLIGLWLGTELTIRGAVQISRQFGLSQLFIGLTILAFGTDLPELVVSINGALRNLRGIESSGVIVGNAIGSSICQISIVLGAAAIFHRSEIDSRRAVGLGVGLLGACALLFLTGVFGTVSRTSGVCLLVGFLIFLVSVVRSEKESSDANERIDVSWRKSAISSLFVFVGLVIVITSSEIVMEQATVLIERWGLEQAFVGAVIIASGTSLPELALTINAGIKKQAGLSLGNILGSNVFDCLVPIGVAATIVPIAFDDKLLVFDLPFLFSVSLYVSFVLGHNQTLRRRDGVALCTCFLIYLLVKTSWIAA